MTLIMEKKELGCCLWKCYQTCDCGFLFGFHLELEFGVGVCVAQTAFDCCDVELWKLCDSAEDQKALEHRYDSFSERTS